MRIFTNNHVRSYEHDYNDWNAIDSKPIEPFEDSAIPPGVGVEGLSGVYLCLIRFIILLKYSEYAKILIMH